MAGGGGMAESVIGGGGLPRGRGWAGSLRSSSYLIDKHWAIAAHDRESRHQATRQVELFKCFIALTQTEASHVWTLRSLEDNEGGAKEVN
jgi:hypothetical protein